MDIALRHIVYSRLLVLLPPASTHQTDTAISNLKLLRIEGLRHSPNFDAKKENWKLSTRLMFSRVTPDANETLKSTCSVRQIELALKRDFGDSLLGIGGFYRSNGELRINLPKNCLLHAYRDRHNIISGILCQPLHVEDRFFLLSSSTMPNGAKAARLLADDHEFFTRYEIEPEPLKAAA
jgi:hypothetical protein